MLLSIALFTIFALACAILEPFLLPLGIIVIAPMDPSAHFHNFEISWTKVLIVVGLGRLLADAMLRSDAYRNIRRSTVAVLSAWGTFIALSAASALWASSSHAAALHESIKYLEYLIAALLAMRYLGDRFRLTVSTIAVWGAVLSVVAVLQLVHGGYHSSLTGESYHRATAIIAGPNQAAGILQVALASGFAYLALGSASWISIPAIVFVMLGIAATASRGGIAAALSIAAIFTAVSLRTRARIVWPAVIAACVAVGFVFATNGSRIAHGLNLVHEIGATQRLDLWTAAIRMFVAHPMLGVGAGNYPLLYAVYGLHDASYYLRTHANSLYLNTAAELGAVGLVLLLLFLFLNIRLGISNLRRNGHEAPSIGLLLVTVGLAVHGFVDDLVFYPQVGLVLFVALGLFLQRSQHVLEDKPVFGRRYVAASIGLFAVATPVAGYACSLSGQLLMTAGLPGAAPLSQLGVVAAPYDPGYILNAGKAAFSAGEYQYTASHLEPIASQIPEAGEIAGDARRALGSQQQANDDWDTAVRAICSQNLDTWRYFEAEQFAADRGRYRTANFCTDVAIQSDPKQPIGYSRAARLALVFGKYRDVERYAVKGLQLEPRSQPLRELYVMALIGQHRTFDAIPAIRTLPKTAQASLWAQLGIAEYELGDVELAAHSLDLSESISPLTDRAAFIRGTLYLASGNATVANRFFIRHGAVVFVNKAAQIDLTAGKVKQALPLLMETARQIPSGPYLERVGNVLLYKLNEPGSSVRWLHDASLAYEDHYHQALTLSQLGDAYTELSRWNDAASAFSASLVLHPNALVALHLGNCYVRLNKWSEAGIAFNKALAQSADPAIATSIIDVYRRNNMNAAAHAFIALAIKKFPSAANLGRSLKD